MNSIWKRRSRWGDNDRHFGPFLYARDRRYRPLAVVLGSGDDDDHPGCSLRLSAFGHTFIAVLPPIIRPWRRKVFANWDAATTERMGRDWYYDTHKREYGFSCLEGFLQVFLGRQTHDSSTEQCWSKFLPWTQWRHVRRSFYDLDGKHFWSEFDAETRAIRKLGRKVTDERWDIVRKWEELCPKATFAFTDFDGQQLTARTHIEEREWRFGEGWFKWLSLFRKPKIRRDLDISFSNETGRRKGSWKGGTTGHSIDMLPGELHEAAFRRYCAEHEMAFIGPDAVKEPKP